MGHEKKKKKNKKLVNNIFNGVSIWVLSNYISVLINLFAKKTKN